MMDGARRGGRPRGGRVSLTAFEAAWLRAVVDTCAGIARDELAALDAAAPDAARDDPYAAWDRIVDKITRVANA